MASGERVELTLERPVAGGAVLGHLPEGPVVLADGGLPGERVVVAITKRAKRHLSGHVIEVIEPSPDRRTPPCPHVADGCGGCDLQHVDPSAQAALKADVVADALRRLGRVAEPAVRVGESLPSTAYRTTVRGLVRPDGRFAYRAHQSHDAVSADGCLTAHPLVRELIDEGRFGTASEVTLRAGVGTGERLAIVHPQVGDVVVPEDVRVVGSDELAAGKRAWIHEEIAGRTFRISARSFFQARQDGAAALVAEVQRQLGAVAGTTVIDAYAGAGLFSAFLADDAEVVGIERSRSSVADFKVNLASRPARVLALSVEDWRPSHADAVVADPSREGLGRIAVDVLAATNAATIVLISCDAAALGRDAGLLRDAGYDLDESVLVDLFPHTHHVEVVSRFTRR